MIRPWWKTKEHVSGPLDERMARVKEMTLSMARELKLEPLSREMTALFFELELKMDPPKDLTNRIFIDSVDQHVKVMNLSGMRGRISLDFLDELESKHLVALFMDGNRGAYIPDLGPLARCSNLRVLSLSHAELRDQDFTPLSRCRQLERLDLISSGLRALDIRPLSHCEQLRTLSLSFNKLDHHPDLTPLQRCKKLQELHMSYLSYHVFYIDLTPVGQLPELRVLDLCENRIPELDLTPLQHCQNLQILDLNHNNFSSIDLEPLRYCQNLQQLNLSCNDNRGLNYINLEPLGDCRQLRVLDLTFINLHSIDLSPLRNCPFLEILRIGTDLLFKSEIPIDLTPLQHCQRLRELDIISRSTHQLDFLPLANHPFLEKVQSWCSLWEIDLEPLATCPRLRELCLRNNNLKKIDLEPFGRPLEEKEGTLREEMPSRMLEHIDLTVNVFLKEVDVTPLLEIPTMKELLLSRGTKAVVKGASVSVENIPFVRYYP